MSEVRDCFERGAAVVYGRITPGTYILRENGAPCEACVNGAIALGYLGDMLRAHGVHALYLDATVPLLGLVLGDIGELACPECGSCLCWEAWDFSASGRVTVRMLIDHLFEDDDLPPLHVVAYVEALTADLTLGLAVPVPAMEVNHVRTD